MFKRVAVAAAALALPLTAALAQPAHAAISTNLTTVLCAYATDTTPVQYSTVTAWVTGAVKKDEGKISSLTVDNTACPVTVFLGLAGPGDPNTIVKSYCIAAGETLTLKQNDLRAAVGGRITNVTFGGPPSPDVC